MEIEFIYGLTLCLIALIGVISPFAYSYLQGKREDEKTKREIEEKKAERAAEQAARRDREQDISSMLSNLIKCDSAMDYIGSRGGNSDQRYDKIMSILSEKPPLKA
ncbi:MAG: hypothetical protein PHV39_04250 [Methanomicrobium sp.]|nr:hypothetical protein [Methanomicrobium sp.]